MAKVRNVSGETLIVPELHRRVQPDEVVEVPDDRVDAFTYQTATWQAEAVSKKSTTKGEE